MKPKKGFPNMEKHWKNIAVGAIGAAAGIVLIRVLDRYFPKVTQAQTSSN